MSVSKGHFFQFEFSSKYIFAKDVLIFMHESSFYEHIYMYENTTQSRITMITHI